MGIFTAKSPLDPGSWGQSPAAAVLASDFWMPFLNTKSVPGKSSTGSTRGSPNTQVPSIYNPIDDIGYVAGISLKTGKLSSWIYFDGFTGSGPQPVEVGLPPVVSSAGRSEYQLS